MAVSLYDVTVRTISYCFKKAWNKGNEASLPLEIPINNDIDDKGYNKLFDVVWIFYENAIPFSSFVLLDNDVEFCNENAGENENSEISAQELESTEPPVDKPFRDDV